MKHVFSLTLMLLQFFTIAANIPPSDFKTFVQQIIPLNENGKIIIPQNIQHIKLDIGLSYSAPMSQYWLTHEDKLIVFGFEPNPASIASIMAGAIKQDPSHGQPLEKKFIGKDFFLIPCALGISDQSQVPFYITNDCGCSSIYYPTIFSIERIIEVPIFSLADFFAIFPFETHPVIDYIKIDTQGSDLNIVKSGAPYIQNHVVFITLEAEDNQYANTSNSVLDIKQYMLSIGFIEHTTTNTQDPTFFNTRFTNYIKNNEIKIFQKG